MVKDVPTALSILKTFTSFFGCQDRANTELMGKFRTGHKQCELAVQGTTYVINFTEGWQTNQRTGTTRRIRCFFGVPIHWRVTMEEAVHFLTPGMNSIRMVTMEVVSSLEDLLNQSRARHDGSECWCSHGNSNFKVVEVFQIRNLYAWRRYQRFVRSLHDKHLQHGITPEDCPPCSPALTNFAWELQVNQKNNERLLLHGTRDLETAKKIAAEGFDSRIREKSGLYGQGAYFAAQTCKSAQYATVNGTRQKATLSNLGTMLIARVAIGHPFYATGPCRERTRNLPQF